MIRFVRALIPLALGAALLLSPLPSGLSPAAWRDFALFATVIVALVTEPLPGPVVGILGITTATALGLVAPSPDDGIRWALSGFSHSTVWLIFVAFMFGLGYEKTGLGPADRAGAGPPARTPDSRPRAVARCRSGRPASSGGWAR